MSHPEEASESRDPQLDESSSSETQGSGEGLDLDGFLNPNQSEGLSIEDLGRAYAELMDQGDDPYQERHAETDLGDLQELVDREESRPEAEDESVSPRGILEAMLFVGNADNDPLTSQRIASFMRGVCAEEIDDLVAELNEDYSEDGAPYEILSEGGGYRLAIRSSYHSLRDRFHGRSREARLSQAAIDVLSIVAYRQPVTRPEIDELRGHQSGSLLSQLVRRRLLKLEPRPKGSKHATYCTTPRFLKLFRLESLDDLPKSEDLDHWTG